MSSNNATSSLVGLARRSLRPANAPRSSHSSALRSLSSSSKASQPHPAPVSVAPSPSLPSSSAAAAATPSPSPFPPPSAKPLGYSLSSQDILSHFARPPFPASNLLGNDAELAKRAMTHESYMYAKDGHNRRLAFLGRRSLKMFATLFLHSCLNAPSLSPEARTYILRLLEPSELDNVLHTSRLGDKVGRTLQLEKAMRWTPAVTDGQLGPLETGLFKIRGVCLEALVGAVYHQAGAQKASRFFHATILSTLLDSTFPQGVPGEVRNLATLRQTEAEKALA